MVFENPIRQRRMGVQEHALRATVEQRAVGISKRFGSQVKDVAKPVFAASGEKDHAKSLGRSILKAVVEAELSLPGVESALHLQGFGASIKFQEVREGGSIGHSDLERCIRKNGLRPDGQGNRAFGAKAGDAKAGLVGTD